MEGETGAGRTETRKREYLDLCEVVYSGRGSLTEKLPWEKKWG